MMAGKSTKNSDGLDAEDRRVIEAMGLSPADYCQAKTPRDLSGLDAGDLHIIKMTGITPDQYRNQKKRQTDK